ncbi:hypothetical protein EV401DRAFT_1969734 [Pisolithus croceorrhizus]|nr:hypothetical protein EV401DRAFT_1969734 [Pisolithus croceorrhizus]
MFEDRIFTTEPEHIKTILATQFNSFEKGKPPTGVKLSLFLTTVSGPEFSDQLSALLGSGVFNSDTRFHRSMTRPFFNKDRVSHFDTFEKHTEDALSQAKAGLQEGYPVDFQVHDAATEGLVF